MNYALYDRLDSKESLSKPFPASGKGLKNLIFRTQLRMLKPFGRGSSNSRSLRKSKQPIAMAIASQWVKTMEQTNKARAILTLRGLN
ncbi:hypothetical protein VF14_25620 [Nostoc linckia z18]|uniref:Uncharacterized protein n=2 Tax=Nostoc linckia TaxID=92942 RepID=A0A9Q5Z615_NOSLI|nr:hypothetical protein VF02_16875 [Nostoc linckia z1]PHJ72019.1 hypothetical protein VF05_05550 [Nostoc linckia z3]PHJ77987.1 hypothetical protein VF03_02815 [Nostoc linckia z2]PHJ84765.1 hypothetical protein VF06_08675 [Nostoc linckia z4]PHJ89793.1 hypothetical protein VF07_11015 [Nostoc linckia z6]PHJ93400.1 hypothetical protein VF04_26090 [Nostoc linckia z7]PHJ95395.1 hypothetical protein VF08_32175 [Nostoc linckia z8]PHK09087.1 hypothetical protein VF09_16905 [Nostoc linckia z9]PHK1471